MGRNALTAGLREIVGVLETGLEDYAHDEGLADPAEAPELVVLPASTQQVAAVLELASAHGVPVTVRGGGTGLSGGCVPPPGSIVLGTARLNRILEIDLDNHTATVQAGVTLAQLEAAARSHGLQYPIAIGAMDATLGGNVATNAGGMQAIKYGVTRHNVLGLEAVLANGELLRCGGKLVKSSSGFDLTQLLIGSEGTLAVVTEVTLKLFPRLTQRATLLAPFATLEAITAAVPKLVAAGLSPLLLEYIDLLTMEGMVQRTGLALGIPQDVHARALAYLTIVFEDRSAERAQEDLELAGKLAIELGALDVYALSPQAGSDLLAAREQAYWAAKQAGANDIVDVVVPRASLAAYMRDVTEINQRYDSMVVGCGHAGDGNVHLAIFQPDRDKRSKVMQALFRSCLALGGSISAEHGIGRQKRDYFLALEDPARLAVMRGIKQTFDPGGILNPGVLLGAERRRLGQADDR